jgi:hypothetical protein
MYGNTNTSPNGNVVCIIRVGKKTINVNFTVGLWSNAASVLHLAFKDYNRINVDNLIENSTSSTDNEANPFAFDVSDFTGTSTGTSNIWANYSLPSGPYYSYDYDNEVDTLNLTAKRFTNGTW